MCCAEIKLANQWRYESYTNKIISNKNTIVSLSLLFQLDKRCLPATPEEGTVSSESTETIPKGESIGADKNISQSSVETLVF